MIEWLPAFAERLAKEGEFQFYARLAGFTIVFTRAELEFAKALVVAENELPVAGR